MNTTTLIETLDRIKRAWELVGSSAPLEKQAQLRDYSQRRLENEWPSLGYAIRQFAETFDPAELYLATHQTQILTPETKSELVDAMARIYERARAAGSSETEALRIVLERTL